METELIAERERNLLLQKEYDEFVTESKQYELMLNNELEQKSSKLDRCERELIRLRSELEALREKFASQQQFNNVQTNNLQDEVARLTAQFREAQRRHRELEQRNDDLERANRNLECTVRSYVERYDDAQAIITQLEFERDEADQLRVELQRIVDERKELKDEIQAIMRRATRDSVVSAASVFPFPSSPSVPAATSATVQPSAAGPLSGSASRTFDDTDSSLNLNLNLNCSDASAGAFSLPPLDESATIFSTSALSHGAAAVSPTTASTLQNGRDSSAAAVAAAATSRRAPGNSAALGTESAASPPVQHHLRTSSDQHSYRPSNSIAPAHCCSALESLGTAHSPNGVCGTGAPSVVLRPTSSLFGIAPLASAGTPSTPQQQVLGGVAAAGPGGGPTTPATVPQLRVRNSYAFLQKLPRFLTLLNRTESGVRAEGLTLLRGAARRPGATDERSPAPGASASSS